MTQTLKSAIALSLVAALSVSFRSATAETPREIPVFEVDPAWPKVPDQMLMGDVAGVSVDAKDNVWIVTRPKTVRAFGVKAAANPPEAICCVPAPAIMEFDADGKYLQGWGGPGPGYDWPELEHGIFVDYKNNVWLGGAHGIVGTTDNHLVKFTSDGKFLLQIGKDGQAKGSLDTQNFGSAAEVYVSPKSNEVFVADGYINRRVIVLDADTGAFKRMWGAYGNKPDDAAPKAFGGYGDGGKQFWVVHGIHISNDGLVYVADNRNNRIQVFTQAGKFVKEGYVVRETKNVGTVFGIAFSADPAQRFIYVPDASNGQVHILDRQTLEVLGEFGRWGPYAGQFEFVHSIAADSQGNVYTTEVGHEQRVQKWIYKGLAPLPR